MSESTPHKCPSCKKDCIQSEGRLDQSGESYLPTTLWRCPTDHCGYQRWDAFQPKGEVNPWRPKYEKVEEKKKK